MTTFEKLDFDAKIEHCITEYSIFAQLVVRTLNSIDITARTCKTNSTSVTEISVFWFNLFTIRQTAMSATEVSVWVRVRTFFCERKKRKDFFIIIVRGQGCIYQRTYIYYND